MTNVTRTVSDSAANATEQMERFESLYNSFFENHVLQLLYLTERQVECLKRTNTFINCKNIVETNPSKYPSLEKEHVHTIGSNGCFIQWVVDSIAVLRKKVLCDPRKNNHIGDAKIYRDKLAELSNLLDNAISPFDDHSLVVWAWWLPQIIELFALTRLVFKEVSKKTEKEGGILLKKLRDCFKYLQDNTTLTVYFLIGDYFSKGQFKNVLDCSEPKKLLDITIDELENKTNENIDTMRKFLDFSNTLSSEHTIPSKEIVLNMHERKKEKLLLEPNFSILLALSHLVLVQHEDDETGKVIIYYSAAKNCLVSLMKTAITEQVKKTPSSEVLFREESAATKLMFTLFFSKRGGENYLEEVLLPTFSMVKKSIFNNEEIDIENPSHVEEIKRLCDEFLDKVKSSTIYFPRIVRLLLSHTQKVVSQKFPEMASLVIGSFLFLRFLIPALVQPSKFRIATKLNSNAGAAIRVMSRILQPIANGGSLRGTLSVFSSFVESNQTALFEYFDSLADISSVSFSRSDLQFDIEVITTYTNFRVIVETLNDRVSEMRQIISVHFNQETLFKYNRFVNIIQPSVFKEVISQDGLYPDIVKNLSDTLPGTATAHLLGFSSGEKERVPIFSWYKRFLSIQSKASTTVKLVPTFQKEMFETLFKILTLHELLNSYYSKWNTPTNPENRKPTVIRKAYLLSYTIRRTREAPISIFIPEAWDIWCHYLNSVDILLKLMILDALSNFVETEKVKNSLIKIIISTRWVISRIITLQNRNLEGL